MELINNNKHFMLLLRNSEAFTDFRLVIYNFADRVAHVFTKLFICTSGLILL